MFGKNKKKEINKNTFGDKDYTMKEKYNADNLFVANLQRTSSEYTSNGPMVETTKQKYIFEKVECDSKTKYREIFTGFITECTGSNNKNGINFQYFDFPYLCNLKRFTDYFPETIGIEIPKLSLIWAQNDINYTIKKDNNTAKTMKKKK